jgi:uncharacterized protein YjiS (DUF1127 family)
VNNVHTNGPRLVSLASVVSPRKWLRRMRERRELLGLLNQPDYILKDIGLERHEITREGLKRFWTD